MKISKKFYGFVYFISSFINGLKMLLHFLRFNLMITDLMIINY